MRQCFSAILQVPNSLFSPYYEKSSRHYLEVILRILILNSQWKKGGTIKIPPY